MALDKDDTSGIVLIIFLSMLALAALLLLLWFWIKGRFISGGWRPKDHPYGRPTESSSAADQVVAVPVSKGEDDEGESEAERKRREAAEAKRQKEEEAKRKKEEEAEKKRKAKEEKDAAKAAAAAAAAAKKADDEAAKKAEEEAAKKAEEERKKKEAAEAERKRKESIAVTDAALTDTAIAVSGDIQFDGNKSSIRPESFNLLDQVAKVLKRNPQVKKIEVGGHTADVGSSAERDAFEMQLSRDRAEAVRAYLIEKGVEPERIDFKGYGDTKPIASNDTKEGREMNRRVEFIITDPYVKPTRAHLTADGIEITESIHFGGNKANILSASHELLEDIAEVLQKHPEVRQLEVGGHTADVGDDPEQNAFEMKLSQERAEAVVNFLVSKHKINASRLKAVGYGDTKPIADNATKEGRIANRRVEFKIVKE